MKRKLGCMAMAAVLSLSLAACGSGEKPAVTESPAAGTETTAAGTAVSYTHLDVYKRQILCFLFMKRTP